MNAVSASVLAILSSNEGVESDGSVASASRVLPSSSSNRGRKRWWCDTLPSEPVGPYGEEAHVSRFSGVEWSETHSMWRASHKGRAQDVVDLGYFFDEVAAAHAVDASRISTFPNDAAMVRGLLNLGSSEGAPRSIQKRRPPLLPNLAPVPRRWGFRRHTDVTWTTYVEALSFLFVLYLFSHFNRIVTTRIN